MFWSWKSAIAARKRRDEATAKLYTWREKKSYFELILKTYYHTYIFVQALNGFLMILTCEGEVFFATHSIESYLGFHQVCMRLIFSCDCVRALLPSLRSNFSYELLHSSRLLAHLSYGPETRFLDLSRYYKTNIFII